MPAIYFLNIPAKTVALQPTDYQPPFDLSPFLLFSLPKYRNDKKNAVRKTVPAKTPYNCLFIHFVLANMQSASRRLGKELHHSVCRSSCEEFLTHVVHVGGDVLEEDLIAGTKVIETWLSVGCPLETQARAFAVTGFEPQALAALAGKGFLLHSAEAVLLRSVKHLRQPVRAYVT